MNLKLAMWFIQSKGYYINIDLFHLWIHLCIQDMIWKEWSHHPCQQLDGLGVGAVRPGPRSRASECLLLYEKSNNSLDCGSLYTSIICSWNTHFCCLNPDLFWMMSSFLLKIGAKKLLVCRMQWGRRTWSTGIFSGCNEGGSSRPTTKSSNLDW